MLQPDVLNTPAPLHERIKQELFGRIGTEWTIGDQLPSVDQLCRQLGTGRSNTWRAVRELVQQGVLISHHGRGTFVKRLPTARDRSPKHASADNVLSGKTILIRRNLSDSFLLPAVDALCEILEDLGALVRCVTFHDDEPRIGADGNEIDAIVMVNGGPLQIREAGPRCKVLIDTSDPWSQSVDWPCDIVGTDSFQGGQLAGEALRQAGCRHVAILGRRWPKKQLVDANHIKRIAGFEHGYGQAVPEDRVLYCKSYQDFAGAEAAVDFLALNPRPDGVFAICDEMAMGFIREVAAHGLHAGRDYQIIGFDGQDRAAAMPKGPLSTIHIPADTMGRHAASLLMNRLKHPNEPTSRLSVSLYLSQGATSRSSFPSDSVISKER